MKMTSLLNSKATPVGTVQRNERILDLLLEDADAHNISYVVNRGCYNKKFEKMETKFYIHLDTEITTIDEYHELCESVLNWQLFKDGDVKLVKGASGHSLYLDYNVADISFNIFAHISYKMDDDGEEFGSLLSEITGCKQVRKTYTHPESTTTGWVCENKL